MTVVGIDVGGTTKGFHGCAIEGRKIVGGPKQLRTADEAVEWIKQFKPTTVALDSPRRPAPAGTRSRCDEKALNLAVCRIRWTGDQARLEAKRSYYGWILHGFELYAGLETAIPEANLIEVFPTAAWTEWIGRRGKKKRAPWTTAGIEALAKSLPDLQHLDTTIGKSTLNQDDRDAIAAAFVACQYEEDDKTDPKLTQAFGEIIVPVGRLP